MTVHELYEVSPQSFVFIDREDGQPVKEYTGDKNGVGSHEVASVKATRYPMFQSVLEVTIKP